MLLNIITVDFIQPKYNSNIKFMLLMFMLHFILFFNTLTQGSSGAMSNHEAWVKSSLVDEEGRQLTQRGVTQPFNPPLTDRGQLVDCNG